MGLQLGLLKASPRPSYFHHWPQITALPSPTFGEFSNTSSGEKQGKNNKCRWERLHGAADSGGRGQAAGRTGDLALASPEERAGSGGGQREAGLHLGGACSARQPPAPGVCEFKANVLTGTF